MESQVHEAAIVGAGPAGLAAAAALRAEGVQALVVDKAAAVGSKWREHYDRLHLHTERALSGLPGLPIPRKHGKWVSRAGVVEYLEEYARHHRIDLLLSTPVERVDRENGAWKLATPSGPVRARAVVIAAGYNHTPHLPDWPGKDSFTGELLHSARYKNAERFGGKHALVVGTGNSGAEIAVDLVEGGAASVRIAVRTPPNIVRREVGPLATQRLGLALRYLPPAIVDPIAGLVQRLTVGDLTPYGLPPSPRGTYTRAREGQIPILDVGLVELLKSRRVTIVAAVRAFEGHDVILEDGQRIQPEVVIAATGYLRALDRLVGHLGVLDARGVPLPHGGKAHPSAPGLYFIGYTNPISGNLREIGIDARKIARALGRSRRT
ncbi:MAG TPA: NAD(P)/FAD-dependent oxidoreductase [Myxococcales bacterium]|nr:NAD(P)/FAD-dependent oxidoreductase [Myxococcales bacterium]